MNIGLCDKCGKEVPRDNDAVEWEVVAGCASPVYLIMTQARHLYPVENCEGSPSRVKWIAENEAGRVALERLKKMVAEGKL